MKDLLEKAESDDAGNCTEIFDDCFEIGKMLLEKDEKEMTWGVLQILRRVCELLEKVNRWTVYYGLLAQYYAEWGEEKDYLYACAQYHNYGIENAIETTKSMLEGIKNRMEIEKNMALQKAQQEQAEEMRLLSETDELTSLLNRRSFNRLSQKYFDTAEDEAAKFGLVMMDIDYFKQYNDEYGHVAGDGCLKGIAQVLKDNESEGFLASRYGGDEFIIICRDRSDDEIVAYMNKILADVNKLALPHIKSPITDHVTVTLGGVNGTPKAEKHTVMDIVQMADDALYEAKAQGKNRAYFEA